MFGTSAIETLQEALEEIGSQAFAITLDPDSVFRFVAMNARARRWARLGEADIAGKRPCELFGAAAGAAVSAGFARCAAAGTVVEIDEEEVRPGLWSYTVLVPLAGRSGEIGRLLGTWTDIGECKRLARALAQADERLRLAARLARFGYWETDLAAGVDYWTDEAYSILGLTPQPSPPTMATFLERVHPEDRAAMWWAQEEVLASQEPCSIEYRAVRPDGTLRHIHSRAVALRGTEGRPVRIVGAGLDITERKQAEEAVQRARHEAEQASLAKTRFLAAASHDLRQPLQAQTLFHEILRSRNRDPALDEVIARLGQSIEAQQQILTGLLNISQIDAGIIRVAKTAFAIQSLLERLGAETRPLAVRQDLDFRTVPCHASVYSDPEILERILRNLLSNALKYTSRGGILLGCRRGGGSLKVQVWDTGSGIPPEHLTTIFEEFHQLDNPARDRSKGLGLGLAIVDRLARLLGHRVEVRSALGRGTVFEINLPLAEPCPLGPAELEGPMRGPA